MYQAEVGKVCDELNAEAAAAARRYRRLERALARAPTTLEQRTILLDDQRRLIEGLDQVLIRFKSLDVPPQVDARHRPGTGRGRAVEHR